MAIALSLVGVPTNSLVLKECVITLKNNFDQLSEDQQLILKEMVVRLGAKEKYFENLLDS